MQRGNILDILWKWVKVLYNNLSFYVHCLIIDCVCVFPPFFSLGYLSMLLSTVKG